MLHLQVFLLGSWLIVLLNHPSRFGLFAAHPPLQSVAIAAFAVGIMTLQPTNQPKTKKRGLSRHQIIMLAIGFPAILVGSVTVFLNKVVNERSHFKTWHAVRCLSASGLTWVD